MSRVSRQSHEKYALNMCYTEGWLHAELTQDGHDVYVFLTTLHRRYLSLCLFQLPGEVCMLRGLFRIMEHKLSLDIPPFSRKQFPRSWTLSLPR